MPGHLMHHGPGGGRRGDDYEDWKARLEADGVTITHEQDWPTGLRSFRVAAVREQSSSIRSLDLEPVDGTGPATGDGSAFAADRSVEEWPADPLHGRVPGQPLGQDLSALGGPAQP